MTPVQPTLPSFTAPYDWPAIDAAVQDVGGAIVKRVFDAETLTSINTDIDKYLALHVGAGSPSSGSEGYDRFLGHDTIRLHGLLEKVPMTAALIGDDAIVGWATRITGGSSGVLLNAGELIEIQPGESAQSAHRDTDSWPVARSLGFPVVVNAITALDDCTLDNGATYVAPYSWEWDKDRRPIDEDWTRAVMKAGDSFLFRGDVVHRGGENTSNKPRRVLSISYCVDWLRTVENTFLTVSRETAAASTSGIQALLGYRSHDGSSRAGGLLGLYENGDPSLALSITG